MTTCTHTIAKPIKITSCIAYVYICTHVLTWIELLIQQGVVIALLHVGGLDLGAWPLKIFSDHM